MRKNLTIFCTIILLAIQAVALAQKTEVSVNKGKVVAETPTASVTVEAGRKAVLLPGKEPIVTVDEPLVNDVMEMYKWAEAEREEQREKIDTCYIVSNSLDDELHYTFAVLNETPNQASEPSDTCRKPGWSLIEDARFYDLQGNLLRFDLEKKVNEAMGQSWVSANYTLHFPSPVAPGEYFRYISVGKESYVESTFWKEGPLRHYVLGSWGGTNCVNYWRFILPKSAIFVESNSRAIMTDNDDGRVALTFRALSRHPSETIPQHIAFLWPHKDGTSLADLPPQYRGLRDRREEELVQEYRRGVAEISDGKTYTDQSTPVATLLSLHSAGVHRDRKVARTLADPERTNEFGDLVTWFSNKLPLAELFRTPVWPTAPAEGQMHRVDLCLKGVLLPEASLGFAYREGKWYIRHVVFGHAPEELLMK